MGDDLDAAWDGGVDGRRVIDLFLNELKNHLKDNGIVQLV
jgi:release factor glutamine methyltransferase